MNFVLIKGYTLDSEVVLWQVNIHGEVDFNLIHRVLCLLFKAIKPDFLFSVKSISVEIFIFFSKIWNPSSPAGGVCGQLVLRVVQALGVIAFSIIPISVRIHQIFPWFIILLYPVIGKNLWFSINFDRIRTPRPRYYNLVENLLLFRWGFLSFLLSGRR